MGASCSDVNFSCRDTYEQNKMLKDLNMKGIFPPEQIRSEVGLQWTIYVPET